MCVLTTSLAPGDIAASYDASANCYMAKAMDLDESIRVIEQFAGQGLLGSYRGSPATCVTGGFSGRSCVRSYR